MKIYRYSLCLFEGEAKIKKEEFEVLKSNGAWIQFKKDDNISIIFEDRIGVMLLSNRLYLLEDNLEKAKEIFIQEMKYRIKQHRKTITTAQQETKELLDQIITIKRQR